MGGKHTDNKTIQAIIDPYKACHNNKEICKDWSSEQCKAWSADLWVVERVSSPFPTNNSGNLKKHLEEPGTWWDNKLK